MKDPLYSLKKPAYQGHSFIDLFGQVKVITMVVTKTHAIELKVRGSMNRVILIHHPRRHDPRDKSLVAFFDDIFKENVGMIHSPKHAGIIFLQLLQTIDLHHGILKK